jgi:heme-degrading monooxygenase HmoA
MLFHERIGWKMHPSSNKRARHFSGDSMFLAMNRFRIAPGKEDDFVAHWRNRNSYLAEVPGFVSFNLLRGDSNDERTLFASHTVWESEAAFAGWTQSDAFRKAHMAAGQSPRDFYLGPPQLELFEAVL